MISLRSVQPLRYDWTKRRPQSLLIASKVGISAQQTKNSQQNIVNKFINPDQSKKTLHGISKPYVQPYLSTFPLSSSLKKKTNKVTVFCRCSNSSNQSSVSGTKIPPAKEQSNKQNCVTNSIDLHCFLSCLCSAQTMEPKANQQIATYTNHFPTYLQYYLIICSNQLQHRTSKKTLIAEKTRQMRISLHISLTINMYTKTYCGDCYHHRSCQSIKRQKPIHIYCVCTKPRRKRNNNWRSNNHNFIKDQITKDHCCKKTSNCYKSPTTCTNPSTGQTGECTSKEWSNKRNLIHY